MKKVRWISGGCLTTMGLVWLLLFGVVAIDAALESNRDPEEATWLDLTAAAIFFGVPPLAAGGTLLGLAVRDRRRTYREQLWGTFYDLLRQNQGRITPLEFAMHTKLSGEAAKAFLDERSREFNADFHVGEAGGIAYYYDLSVMALPPAHSRPPLPNFMTNPAGNAIEDVVADSVEMPVNDTIDDRTDQRPS